MSELERSFPETKTPVGGEYRYLFYPPDTADIGISLPTLDILPATKAVQNVNGTLKIKNKTRAELWDDYAHCVSGLAVIFAARVFNISLAIESVIVSGFVPGRNKKGDSVKVCILSVDLSRDGMTGENLATKDSFDFCMNFRNRCIRQSSGSFKEVVPFTVAEH